MLFVGTSIIHPSTEGVFLLCNILDLLIYSLTTNYIGMVERGEKIPSLETFIKIVNALGVSSDMVLTDVLETGYTVKNSMLNEKLEKLVPEDRNRIYEVIDTLVKQSKQILP